MGKSEASRPAWLMSALTGPLMLLAGEEGWKERIDAVRLSAQLCARRERARANRDEKVVGSGCGGWTNSRGTKEEG